MLNLDEVTITGKWRMPKLKLGHSWERKVTGKQVQTLAEAVYDTFHLDSVTSHRHCLKVDLEQDWLI